MRICGECGVRAPERLPTCGWCAADLSRSAREVPDDERLFVAVQLSFVCRGCALPSPLDGLVGDGKITCVRCRLEQRYDDDDQQALLGAAHAVGDLLHDDPEGRFPSPWSVARLNPLAPLAGGPGVAELGEDPAPPGLLPENLHARLAPGRPLGERDLEPVEVEAGPRGQLLVREGARITAYAVPEQPLESHPLLRGAIADEHREQHEGPELQEVQGTGRFTCTGCGAALPVDGTERLVRCTFCGSVTHVPAQIRHAVQADPQPDTWWLVFEGPSPLRGELERRPPESREIEPPETRKPAGLARAFDLALVVGLPVGALIVAAALWNAPAVVQALIRAAR